MTDVVRYIDLDKMTGADKDALIVDLIKENDALHSAMAGVSHGMLRIRYHGGAVAPEKKGEAL